MKAKKGFSRRSVSAVRKNYWARYCLVLLTGVSLLVMSSLFAFAEEDFTEDDKEKQRVVYDLYNDYKESFPDVREISAREAMALMKTKPVVFVDTRKPKEQKVSMLPGAVTEKRFKNNMEGYEGHVIVGYCTISYRSGKLAEELSDRGIEMLNLKGGMLAWVHEGGKVYDRDGETKRVHVYWKKWNYLPGGYEAVW